MIERQTAVKNSHLNDSPRPLLRAGSPVLTSRGGKEERRTEQYAADLLELFYPIHYRGNMAVEDAMRGPLTRKEAAIIWLIRSAGEGGLEMRRKQIVARLQDWLEVSSPPVTKAWRQMTPPPFSLVRLVEQAESAAEERLRITP